jgi:hypothetical protein
VQKPPEETFVEGRAGAAGRRLVRAPEGRWGTQNSLRPYILGLKYFLD